MIIPLPEIPLPIEDHCRASGLDFLAQSKTSRRVLACRMRTRCAHVEGRPSQAVRALATGWEARPPLVAATGRVGLNVTVRAGIR